MGKGKLRNTKCHCGSGKKYKKCCLAKDIRLVEYAKKGVVFQRQV